MPLHNPRTGILWERDWGLSQMTEGETLGTRLLAAPTRTFETENWRFSFERNLHMQSSSVH